MIAQDFPTTLPMFQARFGDEIACLDYLRAQKWPEGFRCPRCPSTRSYTIESRQLEECAECGHQTSLTAGTMFHGTRKPLSLWFRAIFEFVSRKHGCNAMDIQRLFGFSRKIAWAWLQKIRDAMVSPERSKLKGYPHGSGDQGQIRAWLGSCDSGGCCHGRCAPKPRRRVRAWLGI